MGWDLGKKEALGPVLRSAGSLGGLDALTVPSTSFAKISGILKEGLRKPAVEFCVLT